METTQKLGDIVKMKAPTYTDVKSVLGLCRQRYMCLKLSMANSGRSATVLPMWWSGCVNLTPSAVSAVTTPSHKASNITYVHFRQRNINWRHDT